jgi:chromosome segregation ATPase
MTAPLLLLEVCPTLVASRRTVQLVALSVGCFIPSSQETQMQTTHASMLLATAYEQHSELCAELDAVSREGSAAHQYCASARQQLDVAQTELDTTLATERSLDQELAILLDDGEAAQPSLKVMHRAFADTNETASISHDALRFQREVNNELVFERCRLTALLAQTQLALFAEQLKQVREVTQRSRPTRI